MATPRQAFDGVCMQSVHAVLQQLIYGTDEDPEKQAAIDALGDKYIIPMLHNYVNPISPTSKDTFIEYIIEEDNRVTQDQRAYNAEAVAVKVAVVFVRFIGAQGEQLAKLFHFLTCRTDTANIWIKECNARMLDYISPIMCSVIDYYGHNSALAWDVRLRVNYTESLQLSQSTLTGVSLSQGTVSY